MKEIKLPKPSYTHTYTIKGTKTVSWTYYRAKNDVCQWIINAGEKLCIKLSEHPWLTTKQVIDPAEIVAMFMKVAIEKEHQMMVNFYMRGQWK